MDFLARSCYSILLVSVISAGVPCLAQDSIGGPHISAVKGESWLQHLHRSFDETSMGKTGRLGPPTSAGADSEYRDHSISSRRTVFLSGSDLYRMNCRGCHGESGSGAPPEINSVIAPVQAGSVIAVMQRMKASGMEISRGDAATMAAQSRLALLQRLHNGGQDMPAFPHLSHAEVQLLIGYLKELAAVPGTAHSTEHVEVSRLRVGELIVKSTCHTCHAASGVNPSVEELAEGAIPPLSALTLRVSRTQLIRKVTAGTPIAMGSPPLLYRGRMPVFYYLTEDEAADVYDYLSAYAPDEESQTANVTPLQLAGVANSSSGDGGAPSRVHPLEVTASDEDDSRALVLPIALLLAFFLIAGGLALTVAEMTRASRRHVSEEMRDNVRATTAIPARGDLVA